MGIAKSNSIAKGKDGPFPMARVGKRIGERRDAVGKTKSRKYYVRKRLVAAYVATLSRLIDPNRKEEQCRDITTEYRIFWVKSPMEQTN